MHVQFDLPVDVIFLSAILVCIFSTFFLDVSPATIHKNFKVSGIITINYNSLMAVFGVGSNKSARWAAIISHDMIFHYPCIRTVRRECIFQFDWKWYLEDYKKRLCKYEECRPSSDFKCSCNYRQKNWQILQYFAASFRGIWRLSLSLSYYLCRIAKNDIFSKISFSRTNLRNNR